MADKIQNLLEKFGIKENDIPNDKSVVVIKDGNKTYKLTEDRIGHLTSKFVELCDKEASEYEDFGMRVKFLDMLIKIKQIYWPATKKSIEAHSHTFDKQLELWLKARETMKKEGLIEVENTENIEEDEDKET